MNEAEIALGIGQGLKEKPMLERLTGVIAIIGGLLALAVAVLVVVSVLGRWISNKPIEGDFEFVKMAVAMAVFSYLPYTQARRGNIFVDTFTGWMSPRTRNIVDAFWDFIYAGIMGLFAFGLSRGAMEALKSGETTMQLQLLVWPVIGLCCLLCALLAIVACLTGVKLLGEKA